MKPINQLPFVKGYSNYRYFGVEKKDYQSFTQLKTAITEDAKKNKKVDNNLILECFSMLHDITLAESVYYITEIRDFISKANTFMDMNDLYFEPDYYIEPETNHRYPNINGSDDMLFYSIQATVKKLRRGKIVTATRCLISLITAMKQWIVYNRKHTQYKKTEIMAIAGYITVHFFGKLKGPKSDSKEKSQDYYQIAYGTLKNSDNFDKKFFLEFTISEK